MEVKKLISALEETISLLRNSQASDWASTSVKEVIGTLESEIDKAKNSEPVDSKLLKSLFAPTGSIQETAIDNGWETDFQRISEIIGGLIDT